MWYRQIISHIKGEYWLTDSGHQYADGDVIDQNHEMIAEGHMLDQLGNDINSEEWGFQTYYNAKNMFYDALEKPSEYLGRMDDFVEDLKQEHGDDWWDYADYDSYLMWLNTHNQEDDVKEIRKKWVTNEIAGMKDPRTHVSKHYDWVRVQGNYIEVWKMNDLAKVRIKYQLENIYDEENYEEGDDNWKMSPVFNLSILSTGKYVPNLSYYDLLSYKEKRELVPDSYNDYRTTTKIPTKIPGYQYNGG